MGSTARSVKRTDIDEPRLAELIQHHYGLTIESSETIGGIIRLETDQGRYALKRVRPRAEDRWLLIEELGSYTDETDLLYIPRPVRTKRNLLTINGFHSRYVLLDWIEGEPFLIRSKRDWGLAARLLAEIHRASRSIMESSEQVNIPKAIAWSKDWDKMKKQMHLYHTAASWATKTHDMDQLWLRHSPYIEGMIDAALSYLERIGGDEVCRDTLRYSQLCHGSVYARNFLVDEQGYLQLVDWDRLEVDVRSRELASFLQYAYGKTRNAETIPVILAAYQDVSSLTEAEYALIYARSILPDRSIRILNQIYGGQTVPLEQAEIRFRRELNKEEIKEQWLRTYPTQVEEAFGVKIPRLEWLS
ncbi:phosphotransferase [Mechercharimyces sp. CAU 1602]|uniref:phosphotransferase n=1 Tax=Mechercharimyces sp. CAU 1602 TaxID=2973933 RepID=UPI002161FAFE|nr:phosphotransferase [Mechercharimyces sp. CAU 1602]MCS1351780.1 phosphotransferase [Mechercharimyces sp. CAU 1602]